MEAGRVVDRMKVFRPFYRLPLPAAAVVLALSIAQICWTKSSIADEADWQTYTNHQYQFSLEYPAHLFTRRRPKDDGKGVIFESEDGRRTLTVYGLTNADDLPLSEIVEIVATAEDGRKIVSKTLEDDIISVSGTMVRDGRKSMFHNQLRSSSSGKILAVFELILPLEEAKKLAPLLNQMKDGLSKPTVGEEAENENCFKFNGKVLCE